MKVKDISGKTIKEGDIVNYYETKPLDKYKLIFVCVCKIGVFPQSKDLCLYQGPQISNITYSNGISLYNYQIIGHIDTCTSELLEDVKGI